MTAQSWKAKGAEVSTMILPNKVEGIIYVLLGIVAFFFLILILYGLISWFKDFSQELRYLNKEVKRTEGFECRRWKRRRRRLWLSVLPFVKY